MIKVIHYLFHLQRQVGGIVTFETKAKPCHFNHLFHAAMVGHNRYQIGEYGFVNDHGCVFKTLGRQYGNMRLLQAFV